MGKVSLEMLEKYLVMKKRIDSNLERWKYEPLTIRELSMYFAIKKNKIYGIINYLIEKGYVEIEELNNDYAFAKLTEKGLQNIDEIRKLFYQEARILQIAEALEKIMIDLGEILSRPKTEEQKLNKG